MILHGQGWPVPSSEDADMRYIAAQNDNPIPAGCGDDLIKVVRAAEDWAKYSNRRVHVLDTQTNTVKEIVLP